MTPSLYYQLTRDWLTGARSRVTAPALQAFLDDLNQRIAAQLQLYRKSNHALRGQLYHSVPRSQLRAERASAQHALSVLVPLRRASTVYLQQLRTRVNVARRSDPPELLLGFILRTNPRWLTTPAPRSEFFRELHTGRAVTLNCVSTALSLLTAHPALFPPLPPELDNPTRATLQTLIDQGQRQAHHQARVMLKSRILQEMTLSPEELALLHRVL